MFNIYKIFTGLISRAPTPEIGANATYHAVRNTPSLLARAAPYAKALLTPVILMTIGATLYTGTKMVLAEMRVHSALAQSRETSNKLVDARRKDAGEARERRGWASRGSGYYAIVATLANGKKIYSVRSSTDPIPGSLLRHGGNSERLARVRGFGGRCDTAAEATRLLAQKARFAKGSLRSPSLAAGYVARIGNKSYTIDDWGAVDFGVLRQELRK